MSSGSEALRRTEDLLHDSEVQLSAVVDSAPLVLVACDADGVITLLRGAGLAITGWNPANAIGLNLVDTLEEHAPHIAGMIRRALAGEEIRGTIDLGDKVFDATYLPQFAPDGSVAGLIGVSYDVTAVHRTQDQIRHMAYHDPLTGLANRARLEERLTEALARARRTGQAVALLYIDLDEFKLVNDTLGHAAGDELLCEVARRLSLTTRATDLLCRHGGDEFMLLVEGLTGETAPTAEAVATKVLEALQHPFTIDGTEFQVGASVGISVWPRHGDFPSELLRHADAALYQAKARGRGVHATYEPAGQSSRGRLTLTARLRRALAEDEFELHYQPIFGLESGRQLAMEALVRWNDPERGLVLPGEFIAVAESSGFIEELGGWVLDESCRQIRAWLDAGHNPFVSVNVAPRQLRDPGFGARVAAALATHRVDGARIMVEVTESAAMREPERTDPVLHDLAALGVRLGIDDFGTGHSSLARLRALPFEALKIDRSFLRGVPEQTVETKVMEAVLGLAAALDMVVVAEGVETQAQHDFLVRSGCAYGQGYLLGRPVPAAAMAAGLRR